MIWIIGALIVGLIIGAYFGYHAGATIQDVEDKGGEIK